MDDRTRQLWRRYKFGGDEQAREALVLSNLPLVRHILGRLPVTLPTGLSQEDLASAGVLALLRCIDTFEPERGLEFATYAVPRVRGAMIDELRAHDIVPRSVRQRANAIERACTELRQYGDDAPSADAIGRQAGLSTEMVESTLSAVGLRSLLSLESFVRSSSDGREQRVLDGAADPTCASPLATAMATERRAILAEAIAALPEADRRVITLYYQGDLMLKEIAEILSVTKSRVSQIHSRALFRLRDHVATALAARSTQAGEGLS